MVRSISILISSILAVIHGVALQRTGTCSSRHASSPTPFNILVPFLKSSATIFRIPVRGHGEGIYGARYWSVKQISGDFRYATKPEAFFIHHFEASTNTATVPNPVPWLEGDVVTVLDGSQNGREVSASRTATGGPQSVFNDAIANGEKYVWSLKIAYATR
ncbi:Hypothetical protein D9617_3g022060 [Elsinoe fawcettii]|nr:Hypothetical protein D9617_3g022060 [Elsinoe fawcettii]